MAKIEIRDFLEKYVKGWMFRDIEDGIRSNSNFLVALGLMTYTEILGGVIRCIHCGTICDVVFTRGNSKENFNACFKELGECYEKVAGGDPYGNVRSGLVHQYFIKFKGAKVTNNRDDIDGSFNTYENNCGVYEDANGRMNLITNIYFRDLRNKVDTILQDLDTAGSREINIELIETQPLENINSRQYNLDLSDSFKIEDRGISGISQPPNTSIVGSSHVVTRDKPKKEPGDSNE